MPSYAAFNQHCLALTSFDQCFLSTENTSAIVMLQASVLIYYKMPTESTYGLKTINLCCI